MTTKKLSKGTWVTLVGFIALIGLLGTGLSLNPRLLPAKMVNQPFPNFKLEDLAHPKRDRTRADILGQPALVHIWATWCGICLNEHNDLLQIAHRWPYPIYSVLYQDDPKAARQWLKSRGNPYAWTVVDYQGRLGIELGVYGTPETYLIDRQGVIRYRLVGPLTVKKFKKDILPRLEAM